MSLKNPITSIDKLAAFRKALEHQMKRYKEKLADYEANHNGSMPQLSEFHSHTCETKHYNMDERTTQIAEQIRKQILG